MPREYPKFIYQNVTGTKSDGEYVVHLLEPRVVFKVHRNQAGKIGLQCLDNFCPPALHSRATDWVIAHLTK